MKTLSPALSCDVLIRHINLAQSWREWLLSTTAVDYQNKWNWIWSAVLVRGIVFGSEYQPIGTAQLSIIFLDYDWNKSFHCDGLSTVIVVTTADDRLKNSNSSYEQQTR